MKRYNSKFVYTKSFINEAILDCLKDRWKRTDVSYFLAEYAIKLYPVFYKGKSIHVVAQEMYTAVRNKEQKQLIEKILIPQIAEMMLHDINCRTITLKPIQYQYRYDAVSGKVREIGVSTIKQQVFDYIAVNSCKNMFDAKIGKYQCASLPERGQVYGKRSIERWIRQDPLSCKYISQTDVKQYYPSVNHKILKKYLKRDIKNKDCLYLLCTLIDTYKNGLCIGSYLSQYLANYYISYAYHYINEQCFHERKSKRDKIVKKERLIDHVLFYMDDILLFGSNKKYVKKAQKMLEEYLKDNLDLTLKNNKKFFTVDKGIDTMGYVIYPDRTIIRRKNYIKIARMLRKYKGSHRNMSVRVAYRIASYNGYLKHSDSHDIRVRFKADKTINKAKGIISKWNKQHSQIDNQNIAIFQLATVELPFSSIDLLI